MADVQYLQRPGGRIAFEAAGDGPAVVCVPGMGELRSSYRSTVPSLVAAGLRAVTMDLRGHGDSDATFAAYDDAAAGSDVIALIQHLGLERVVVVGNSMGAGAAVLAAAERPDNVAGLVLVGPFVRNTPINPVMRVLFRLMMSGPWATRAWTSYLPSLYPGRKPADFAEHQKAVATSLRLPGHARAFRRTTRTSHAPAEARLDDVRCPSLVVMGLRDPDFPDPSAEAGWIADRLGSETVLIPEAGHYPQVEYPEVVNPRLADFCARVMTPA